MNSPVLSKSKDTLVSEYNAFIINLPQKTEKNKLKIINKRKLALVNLFRMVFMPYSEKNITFKSSLKDFNLNIPLVSIDDENKIESYVKVNILDIYSITNTIIDNTGTYFHFNETKAYSEIKLSNGHILISPHFNNVSQKQNDYNGIIICFHKILIKLSMVNGIQYNYPTDLYLLKLENWILDCIKLSKNEKFSGFEVYTKLEEELDLFDRLH